jgi:feruloyl-CoA synthase
MNLVAILESNTRKSPDKDCLRANGQGVSYRTLREEAEKAAGLLQQMGLSKGDRIAIMSQNTVGFVIAFYGSLMAGGVVVPINHKLMAPEVDYILGHREAKVFLFDGSLAGVAGTLSSPVRKLALDSSAEGFERFEDLLAPAPTFSPWRSGTMDLAEILYTPQARQANPRGACITTGAWS